MSWLGSNIWRRKRSKIRRTPWRRIRALWIVSWLKIRRRRSRSRNKLMMLNLKESRRKLSFEISKIRSHRWTMSSRRVRTLLAHSPTTRTSYHPSQNRTSSETRKSDRSRRSKPSSISGWLITCTLKTQKKITSSSKISWRKRRRARKEREKFMSLRSERNGHKRIGREDSTRCLMSI